MEHLFGKMKSVVASAAIAAAVCGSAFAATTTYDGVEIEYTGAATADKVGNDLVIKYTSGSGTLVIPDGCTATARILAVGGGARGVDGSRSGGSNRGGNGGYGGRGTDSTGNTLQGGTYTITVGNGQTSSANAQASSFSGNGVTVSGAAAATNQQGFNSPSDITGASVRYGARGATGTNSSHSNPGSANTGNGGDGGYGQGNAGGNGGSGIVVVRISAVTNPTPTWTCPDLVHISLNASAVVKDADGNEIVYGDDLKVNEKDEEVAVVDKNDGGFVVIKNAGRDGQAVVSFTTGGKKYVYNVLAATIDVSKKIIPDPEDNTKATIRIVTHALHNPKPRVPNVLFVGTACGAHGLTAKEIANAINAIHEIGSVDYMVYTNSNGVIVNDGALEYGDGKSVAEADFRLPANGAHYALKAFYNAFDSKLTNPATSNKYDYIVIETDGSRLALEYNDTARGGGKNRDIDQEKRVATLLKPFYDKENVIWIVDDGYDMAEYFDERTQPPAADRYKTFPYGTEYGLFRPSNVTFNNSGEQNQYIKVLNDDQWMGLLGIFSPANYLVGGTATTSYTGVTLVTAASGTFTTTETKATDATPNQIFYGHADEIGDSIRKLVKPIPCSTELVDSVMKLQDSIYVDGGADGVSIFELDKEKAEGVDPDDYADNDEVWKDITDTATWSLTDSTVTNNVSGITEENWSKLEIKVVMTEDFMELAIAKKESDPSWPGIEKTEDNKWLVNPNDGDAVVTLTYGDDEESVEAKVTAKAEAETEWEVEDNKSLTITPTGVDKIYDGVQTNFTFVVTDQDGEPIEDGAVSFMGPEDGDWVPFDPSYFVNVTNVTLKVKVVKDGYDDGTAEGVVVKIDQKAVTVTADNKSKIYGESDPEFTATVEGTIGTDTVEYTVTCEHDEDVLVGDGYDIEPDGEESQGNYIVEFVPGGLTIIPAPITPKVPTGSADNPGEEPAEDPSADPSIWARNIVKCYDGTGTNVVAEVYNYKYKDKNNFTYEYSTNEVDFVAWDALQFTNVVSAQKVWYTAKNTEGNYLNVTNFAYVTITQKVVTAESGVIANDTNMVFGTSAPAIADLTWRNPTDLAKGDYVDSVKLSYTNEYTTLSTLAVGEYEGMVSTNGDNAIVIKNTAGEDVTANYVMGFTPGKLTVDNAQLGFRAEDAEKTYDGIATNVQVVAVTNAVTGAAVSGYTVSNSYDNATWVLASEFDGYTDVTNKATVYIMVVADGYATATGTAKVTITPAPVTITSGTKTDFTYDGEPHAYTNLTVTGVGFVAGEGLKETNGWATVSTVAEGQKDNAFSYTLLEGTEASNYEITVVTGKIAVAAAPINPKEPEDPTDNPGDEPDPTEGPTIWAQNIVKVYDGIGTNVVAEVYNYKGENNFTYEYSTNEVDFVAWEDLQFTDVVSAQKVWYTAKNTEGNYLNVTNFAYVTILPRPIDDEHGADFSAVVADNQQMVEGDTVPVPTYKGGKGILDGHFLSVKLAYTNDPNYSAGVYPEAITTNALIAVTNAVGKIVTANYAIVFNPGTLTVTPNSDAMLTGELAWAFDQGTGVYFAQFKVKCTNMIEKLDKESVKFVFQDRTEGQDIKASLKVWDGKKVVDAPTVQYGSETFRAVDLDCTELTALDQFVTFGPATTTPSRPRYWVVPVVDRPGTFAMYVMKRLYPVSGNEALAEVADFTGYLVWKGANGTYAIPVTAGEVAGETINVPERPALSLSVPLTVRKLNMAVAYNLPLTDDSDPICIIADAVFGDDFVSGKVQLRDGDNVGAPGVNAKVTLFGAVELGDGFSPVSVVKTDADGWFTIQKPADLRFFMVKVEVEELYK